MVSRIIESLENENKKQEGYASLSAILKEEKEKEEQAICEYLNRVVDVFLEDLQNEQR
jgi:hypothetical protein